MRNEAPKPPADPATLFFAAVRAYLRAVKPQATLDRIKIVFADETKFDLRRPFPDEDGLAGR